MLTLSILSLILAASIGVALQERRFRNRKELQQHYLRLILHGGHSGERYIEQLSRLGGNEAKRVAAEVAARLAPVIYRLDEEPLLHLNRSLHLSDFLLSKALSTHGARRAHYLSLLSRLPSETITLQQIKPLLSDENRMVRFFAMIISINIDKGNLLHYVASFEKPLTPFEISYLLGMLRQGAIVVAYRPMLNSLSINLNLLGLAVVRQFGVEDAEQMLCSIIECSESYPLRREALYTLASMQLSLSRLPIAAFVRGMSHDESQRFLRYVASVGYAQCVIDFFASKCDREYFHALINSYKIKIRCS